MWEITMLLVPQNYGGLQLPEAFFICHCLVTWYLNTLSFSVGRWVTFSQSPYDIVDIST